MGFSVYGVEALSVLTDVTVRDVTPQDLASCVALYADVMRLRDGDGSINPRMLAALQANGGLVLGAYRDDELVGFTYGFLGHAIRDSRIGSVPFLYHYSQLAVVTARWQGRGIGRQLKMAQRDRCLRDGIAFIRWAFDPLKTRNGHFNLNVLGARVIKLVPSMYGSDGYLVDAGDDTDRFIVEWDLVAPNDPGPIDAQRCRDLDLGDLTCYDGTAMFAVPASWDRFRAEHSLESAADLRRKLRAHLLPLIGGGSVGVACDVVDAQRAVYRFVPGMVSAETISECP